MPDIIEATHLKLEEMKTVCCIDLLKMNGGYGIVTDADLTVNIFFIIKEDDNLEQHRADTDLSDRVCLVAEDELLFNILLLMTGHNPSNIYP